MFGAEGQHFVKILKNSEKRLRSYSCLKIFEKLAMSSKFQNWLRGLKRYIHTKSRSGNNISYFIFRKIVFVGRYIANICKLAEISNLNIDRQVKYFVVTFCTIN